MLCKEIPETLRESTALFWKDKVLFYVLTGTTGCASPSECAPRTSFANTASNITRQSAEWHAVWSGIIAVDTWRHWSAETECKFNGKCTAVDYNKAKWTTAYWVNGWWVDVTEWRSTESAFYCSKWIRNIETTTSQSMWFILLTYVMWNL